MQIAQGRKQIVLRKCNEEWKITAIRRSFIIRVEMNFFFFFFFFGLAGEQESEGKGETLNGKIN